jgi:hypothetical protein
MAKKGLLVLALADAFAGGVDAGGGVGRKEKFCAVRRQV